MSKKYNLVACSLMQRYLNSINASKTEEVIRLLTKYQTNTSEKLLEYMKKDGLIKYDLSDYSEIQLDFLQSCINSNVDVTLMLNPEFSPEQMEQIYLGLRYNMHMNNTYKMSYLWLLDTTEPRGAIYIDVALYAHTYYNAEQMRIIREGLERGLDVFWYSNPMFNARQMDIIRKGLLDGVDVSIYASPNFAWDQMYAIHLGLVQGLPAWLYANTSYSTNKMATAREALKKGLDIRPLLRSKISDVDFVQSVQKSSNSCSA